MAKVVFSLTDAQVKLLATIGREGRCHRSDARTFTSLRKVGLIEPVEKETYRPRWGKWRLTPAGKSAIALCERLANLTSLLSDK